MILETFKNSYFANIIKTVQHLPFLYHLIGKVFRTTSIITVLYQNYRNVKKLLFWQHYKNGSSPSVFIPFYW